MFPSQRATAEVNDSSASFHLCFIPLSGPLPVTLEVDKHQDDIGQDTGDAGDHAVKDQPKQAGQHADKESAAHFAAQQVDRQHGRDRGRPVNPVIF